MPDREHCNPQCFTLAAKVHEVLQTVENALIEAGKGDFFVTTEHGSFRWQTTERAREAERLNGDKRLMGDVLESRQAGQRGA